MEEQASNTPVDGAYTEAKASKFHFKSGSKRRSKRREGYDEADGSSSKRRHDFKRRRTHRHHSSDKHTTSTRDGRYYDPDHRHRESLYDDLDPAGTTPPKRDPEEAFRESLFDALADDEGAAYWEGVYGQPVHVYSDTKPGPDGKLERMSEEEYAEYVRHKMWEKTHQHIVEEREAREKARRKKKEQQHESNEGIAREEAEREEIRQRMTESLRRGQERKKAKEAAAAWAAYLKRWEELKKNPGIAQQPESEVRKLIPWPVASAESKDISREEIESFLRASHASDDDLLAMLKIERVRWHPDKMQQRFGQHIDAHTMKLVTSVFQVIDRLWIDRRPCK